MLEGAGGGRLDLGLRGVGHWGGLVYGFGWEAVRVRVRGRGQFVRCQGVPRVDGGFAVLGGGTTFYDPLWVLVRLCG